MERHQHEKLENHLRRGNLNGLPNLLDIFRTLNGLLVTFNKRTVKGVPVIPHPSVTSGIMINLDLLMGAVDAERTILRDMSIPSTPTSKATAGSCATACRKNASRKS